MSDSWEKISNQQKRDDDKITITKSLAIGFTNAMYDRNNIMFYDHIKLFYNWNKNMIGIQLTTDSSSKDSFRIIHRTNRKGASVKARNLFKDKNIDVERYRGAYDYKEQEIAGIGKLFVIELKEREEE